MAPKTPVSPMDPSKNNSPKTNLSAGENTVIMDSASNECFWNGQAFVEGDLVECEGETYECSLGRWVKSG